MTIRTLAYLIIADGLITAGTILSFIESPFIGVTMVVAGLCILAAKVAQYRRVYQDEE